MKILFHYPLPVLLKSKFTVTWVSILETQDSILETFKDRVLSLESWWSRIEDKFQISSQELVVKEHTLKVYTEFPLIPKITVLCIGWDSFGLIHVNKACALKGKICTFGLLLIVLLKLALEVKARYIYVIAVKLSLHLKVKMKQLILEMRILISLVHSVQP